MQEGETIDTNNLSEYIFILQYQKDQKVDLRKMVR